MTSDSEARRRARRRRASGTVADFDGKRLALARRLRGIRRTTLASQVGVSAAAITQFERGGRPTRTVAAELALALCVPIEFFQLGHPIEPIPASAAHFRSLRATPAISRDRALAFAEMASAVADLIEQYVDVPAVSDFLEPIDDEPTRERIAEIASRTRARLGVQAGPVPHVLRLMESHGVVTFRLPPDIDTRVDAFSTDVNHRPLVFLSPQKNDRARSRFDAAHELGHLVMHQDVEPGSKIVETQAHNFAAEFLAPLEQLEEDLPRRIDWDSLIQAKMKWGLSLAALVRRCYDAQLWSEHSYRRANQKLRSDGYPEIGPLGPPESPYLMGAAAELLEQSGVSIDELSRISRFTRQQISEVIAAGSESRPKLRVAVSPSEG